MNERANRALQEARQTGRLRVNVGTAYMKADDLVRLITDVCLLKKLAEVAALNYGQTLDIGAWIEAFNMFEQGTTEVPTGRFQ